MSKETWRQEHYPISAAECSKADAIHHSLTKWLGLRKDKLELHGVTLDDVDEFVSGGTCALCIHYEGCSECPLAQAIVVEYGRGSTCCRLPRHQQSPWLAWLHDGNPEPMILWLERSLKRQIAATEVAWHPV